MKTKIKSEGEISMIEIINRCEGEKYIKNQIEGCKAQVSYNNDNRLVIRIIQDGLLPGSGNPNFVQKDTLIVFDAKTSELIKDFCQYKLFNRQTGLPF